VVLVPALAEELLFRGFAYSALRSLGVSPGWVALITAAAWAVVHVQYDFYWILVIFVGGLLLAEARRRTESIVPAIAMHATVGAVGLAEVAFAYRGG
jgi:membrane protease YdiL (CAAX protease family)